MSNYSRVCPRCNGTGRYDRGTCFTCNGAKRIKSATPPKPEWEASAVFNDGVRRYLCTKASEAAALKAGEEKIAKGPEFWIAGTIEVRKK